jgi:hypothetical protein
MKCDLLPEKRWNWRRFSTVFPPEIAKNGGREGVRHLMKISMIEALVPAAGPNKSN